MFTVICFVFAAFSACTGQFLNCGWVASLVCTKYPASVLCGTDGVDYNNKCYYAKAACLNKNLHIQGEGTCASLHYVPGAKTTQAHAVTTPPPVVITTPTGPTTTHKPVFLNHNAILDFFCLELSREKCPNDTEAVCGTDGDSYENFCEYEKSRCTHRDLNVAHYGTC